MSYFIECLWAERESVLISISLPITVALCQEIIKFGLFRLDSFQDIR